MRVARVRLGRQSTTDLGERAVVAEAVAVLVEPQLPLRDVLGDRVPRVALVDLELGAGA